MNLPSSQVSCPRAYTSFQVDTRFIDGVSVILYHAVVMLIIQRSFLFVSKFLVGLKGSVVLRFLFFCQGLLPSWFGSSRLYRHHSQMSARWLGGFHALLFTLSLLSSMGLGSGPQNRPVYTRYNFF
jgi:hypothetical protein